MNKWLKWTFACAYIAVTLLLLGGVVKHSQWFLAGLEPVSDDWFGWWLAAALDGALIVSTCTLVAYQLQQRAAPAIISRAFYLFLLYSTVANLSHALAHNHLQDWSSGYTWWYYFSSIIGAALLPTALAIMPHSAEAVLAGQPQPAPQVGTELTAELQQKIAQLERVIAATKPQPASQIETAPAATPAATTPQPAPQIETAWAATKPQPASQIEAAWAATTPQPASQIEAAWAATKPQPAPQIETVLAATQPQPLPQIETAWAASFADEEPQPEPQEVTQKLAQSRRITSRKVAAQTEPRTVAEIAATVGLSSDTVRRKVTTLVAAGKAQMVDGKPARYIVRNAVLKN